MNQIVKGLEHKTLSSSIAEPQGLISRSSSSQLICHTRFTFSCAHRWFGVLGLILCFHANSFAQPNRIAQRIDNGERITIRGTLHPLAESNYDQGRADASMQLDRLMLVLKPSPAQAADLDRFLAEVHDPKSSNYHKWLTPESYADRFGLSQADMDKVVAWLAGCVLILPRMEELSTVNSKPNSRLTERTNQDETY